MQCFSKAQSWTCYCWEMHHIMRSYCSTMKKKRNTFIINYSFHNLIWMPKTKLFLYWQFGSANFLSAVVTDKITFSVQISFGTAMLYYIIIHNKMCPKCLIVERHVDFENWHSQIFRNVSARVLVPCIVPCVVPCVGSWVPWVWLPASCTEWAV